MNPRGNSKNIRTAESAASIAVTASFVVFAGVVIEFVKILVKFLIKGTSTGGVGELDRMVEEKKAKE